MDQQRKETAAAAGCAVCNHMRHRCLPNCIFAPYFPANSQSFDYVNQVYSISNIKKILESVPVERRGRKAESLAFEAEARVRDPELGCVGYIYLLEQHYAQIERDIQEAEARFSAAGYYLQPPPEQQYWHPMPRLSPMTTPPYHELQPADDLSQFAGAATYPSMSQAEPIPINPSTTTASQIKDDQMGMMIR